MLLQLSVVAVLAQENEERNLYFGFTAYLENLAQQQLDNRQEIIENIKTEQAARERQAYVKETIIELIGGLPERTPLNVKVVGTLERDGYRIEKVIYESRPDFHVTANVYVPTTGTPPFPGIVSPCGHSHNGKASRTYQSLYISLAKKGFVVLAYDPIGQGERYQYFHPWLNRSMVGRSTWEHTVGAIQAIPIGLNIAQFRIWDGIRSIDYLISRPDVDGRKIGITGNSGGGTMTAYLSALDDRLKVSVPSCYITSWRQQFFYPGPQDGEQNFVFSIEKGLDHADFIEAFAPKPLQIAAAIQDFFPIEGTRLTYKESNQFYRIFEAENKIALFEADDTHGFSLARREATYYWMRKWLQGIGSDEGEPEHTVEADWDLLCTSTGQVLTEFPNEETVATIMDREKEFVKYRFNVPKSKQEYDEFVNRMKPVIRNRLRLSEKIGSPEVVQRIKTDGMEKIRLRTEPGIMIPVTIFNPESGNDEIVLYLHDSGRDAEFKDGGEINSLVEEGNTVCAVDVRGIGELAPESRDRSGQDFIGSHYKIGMQSLLVGKTLVGMQVHDIQSVLNFLNQQREFKNSKISCITNGFIGVAALHAAALDDRIVELTLTSSLMSYDAVARNPISQQVFMTLVPSALRDYDLPLLAAMMAPRKLHLIETLDQMKNTANPYLVKHDYQPASQVYEGLFQSENFVVE